MFAIVGVFSNFMLILLALFIYMTAKGESRVSLLADLLEGFTASDLAVTDLPRVEVDTTIGEFAERMLLDHKTSDLVTEDGLVVEAVTLADVSSARQRDREPITIGNIASWDLSTVEAITPAFDAVAMLGQHGASFVLVECEEEIAGVITNESLAQVLVLRESGLELKRDVQPF